MSVLLKSSSKSCESCLAEGLLKDDARSATHHQRALTNEAVADVKLLRGTRRSSISRADDSHPVLARGRLAYRGAFDRSFVRNTRGGCACASALQHPRAGCAAPDRDDAVVALTHQKFASSLVVILDMTEISIPGAWLRVSAGVLET